MSRSKPRKAKNKALIIDRLIQQQPLAKQTQELLDNIQAMIDLKQTDMAFKLLATLQEVDPANPGALYLLGELEMQRGNREQAIQYFSIAIYHRPNDAKVLRNLAKLHAQLGHYRAAMAAVYRIIELLPESAGTQAQAVLMKTLGALYYMAGRNERGSYWISHASRLKPFSHTKASKETKLRVLILNSAESTEWRLDPNSFVPAMVEGHNNLSSLLDSRHIEVCRMFVDHLDEAPEIIRKLPPVDLVYNGITDAERCAEALAHAQHLCERLNKPVINEPKAVLAASREGNYARFKNNPNIILPKSVKVENTQQSARAIVEQVMQQHDFTLPVIVRLAGFQGGKFMHKVDDLDSHDFSELDEKIAKEPQTVYVVQYHEFGYRDEHMPDDMLYLKYRAFLIGGKLYPAHLRGDINQYKVHINNQIFELCPWLEDFEDHFLRDPADYFGGDNWRHLEAALCEMGLDYTGVDFAVAKAPEHQGKILIFEANAAMRNWPTLRNDTPEVYGAWQNNLKGVHDLLCVKTDIEPWEFVVPQIEVTTQSLTAQSVVSTEFDKQGGKVTKRNKDADAVMKPASLTKVMLSLVVLDNVTALDEPIEVIEADLIGGSGNNLLPGDVLSWHDALRNMLMASSHVTANVVCRHVGLRLLGDDGASPEQAWQRGVQALNDKAVSLGMTATRFTNPSGLDHAEMRTTANDMIKVGESALGYPELLAAWGATRYTLRIQGKLPRDMAITTTVKPLADEQAGILGGKTGTLPDGTQHLMLHSQTPDGRDRITVLMQVGGDRYSEMQMVLDTLDDGSFIDGVSENEPCASPASTLALRLHITGKVQGVGYRRWFANQLTERGIPGWIRNLADGSVEAVIHGPQETLQPLLDEVPTGPKGSDVTGLNAELWEGELPEGVQVLADAAP